MCCELPNTVGLMCQERFAWARQPLSVSLRSCELRSIEKAGLWQPPG